MIYFLQGGEGMPVKIGYSTNRQTLQSRIATLQTGYPYYPLKPIWVIEDGPIEAEHDIHKLLSSDRLCGEWFEFSSRVDCFLRCVWTSDTLDDAVESFKCKATFAETALSDNVLAIYETQIGSVFEYPVHKIIEARKAGAGPKFVEVYANRKTPRRVYLFADVRDWLEHRGAKYRLNWFSVAFCCRPVRQLVGDG